MEVRSDEKWMNRAGLTYQRVLNCLLDALTQNTFPTGEFPQKIKFGGKTAKMEVRVDGNQTDRNRHTCKRALSHLLNPLTQNMPATGEMDDLRGPTCGPNGYLCNNDLETCKNRDKRTEKEGKGQPSANRIKDLVQLKWTATRAAMLTTMQRPQWSHVIQVPQPLHNVALQQRDSLQSAMHPMHHDLWSTAAPNKIYHFSGHLFGETDDLVGDKWNCCGIFTYLHKPKCGLL